jgi:hypothetical protein
MYFLWFATPHYLSHPHYHYYLNYLPNHLHLLWLS